MTHDNTDYVNLRNSRVLRYGLTAIALFGAPVLISLGVGYGFLSVYQASIAMLVWYALLALFVIFQKLTRRKGRLSNAISETALEDQPRRHLQRQIRFHKVVVGFLLVCLPLVILRGVSERAWLPTLIGVGISLWLMYAEILQIRRKRKQLD